MRARCSVDDNGSKSGQAGHGSNKEATQTVRKPQLSERTDYTRWRLLDERGRQTWHYLENDEDVKEWPQSTADKYFLGLPTV
jgi:lanosterol synthase